MWNHEHDGDNVQRRGVSKSVAKIAFDFVLRGEIQLLENIGRNAEGLLKRALADISS